MTWQSQGTDHVTGGLVQPHCRLRLWSKVSSNLWSHEYRIATFFYDVISIVSVGGVIVMVEWLLDYEYV